MKDTYIKLNYKFTNNEIESRYEQLSYQQKDFFHYMMEEVSFTQSEAIEYAEKTDIKKYKEDFRNIKYSLLDQSNFLIKTFQKALITKQQIGIYVDYQKGKRIGDCVKTILLPDKISHKRRYEKAINSLKRKNGYLVIEHSYSDYVAVRDSSLYTKMFFNSMQLWGYICILYDAEYDKNNK